MREWKEVQEMLRQIENNEPRPKRFYPTEGIERPSTLDGAGPFPLRGKEESVN